MLSAFYIFSSRGDVLVKEKYQDDISEDLITPLISEILREKSELNGPYTEYKGVYGYSLKIEKLTYLALAKRELPAIAVIRFLESFYSLVRNFCGGATEDLITKNLLLVYELMTECVDNGFIKTVNTEQIRHTIFSDPVPMKVNPKYEVRKPGLFGMEKVCISNSAAERPLVKSRSQQSLKTAEVFVDVIEKLTAHFDNEGQIQLFYLHGTIQLKSFIPHNHRIIVSLESNQKQESTKDLHLDQHSFDSCVDSSKFDKHRSFTVIPSQGEIKAMTYSLDNFVTLPFRLTTSIQESQQNRDCDITLKLMCNLPVHIEALNICLQIPVSSSTRNIMQQFSKYENSAEFIHKDRKILWKLKKLPGQEEVVAKFKLIDAMQLPANRLEMGPVSLEFEASHITCSALEVKDLKADDPSGRPIPIQKWVRYATVSQSYVFKI